jgi:hypothetical protein
MLGAIVEASALATIAGFNTSNPPPASVGAPPPTIVRARAAAIAFFTILFILKPSLKSKERTSQGIIILRDTLFYRMKLSNGRSYSLYCK